MANELTKRRLGRTELMVTELSLGGYMFTGEFGVPQDEAHAIMDAAFASGVNFIDTAQMYGFGEGEEMAGRALRRFADRPIHVATKVGYLDRTIVRNLGDAAYADEDALRRAIRHSLWLLQRDHIDIVFVHEPDRANWWGDGLLSGKAPVLGVLEEFKAEGVVGAIGIGGWICDNIADLIETGRFDVALVAGGYTLVKQPVRERVIPAARKHDVGLVIGGTFFQGFLASIRRQDMLDMQASGEYGFFDAETVRRILAVYDLCEETGLSITDMAIRYILADPDIHAIIPGAQRVSHIEANIQAALAGPLPEELVKRIDAITSSASANSARAPLCSG